MNKQLSFSYIPCPRCGSQRVLEMRCPDCGQEPRPGEVNGHVVRRRQRVRLTDTELLTPHPGDSGAPTANPQEELAAFPDEFFSALSSAILSSSPAPSAPRTLARSIQRLQDLIDGLHADSRRRPSAEARAYLAVAQKLAQLWPIYREAVTTPDISRAQTLAVQGQTILDDAPVALAAMGTIAEAVDVLSDKHAEPSLIRRVMRSLSIRYPDMDFAALTATGVRNAREVAQVEVGAGPGLDYLTIELITEAFLDPAALATKLREAIACCRDEHRLLEIASMEGSLDDLAVLRRDIFETLDQFTQVTNQDVSAATKLRRLVKTVGELYEAAVPILAWYRLLTGESNSPDSYQRFVQKDSTQLVTDLSRKMPITFADMPSHLRNSAHHGRALDIDDATDTITIKLRSHQETLPVEDYLDRMLALLETVIAVNWALSEALDRAGIEVPLPPEDADQFGLSQPDLAAFWLETVRGFDIHRSEVRDGAWLIEASLTDEQVLYTALSLSTSCEDRIHSITVASNGTATEALEIDRDTYERFAESVAEAQPEDHLLALLELRHQTTHGQECMLDESDVLYAALTLGASLLEGDTAHVPRLRKVVQIAKAHGFNAAAQLASSAIRSLRAADTHKVRDEIARGAGNLLVPGFPFGSRVTVHCVPQHRDRPCDS